MSLERPRTGELVAGAAGAVLLASLFLPWYGGGPDACIQVVGVSCPPAAISGWGALTVLDAVLAIVALAGVGLLAVELTRRPTAISVALAALTALVATLAVPWVLFRTLDVPARAEGLEPRFALLGLAATAGVAAGAWLSMRDEGFGLRPAGDIGATTAGRPAPDAEMVSLRDIESRAKGAS